MGKGKKGEGKGKHATKEEPPTGIWNGQRWSLVDGKWTQAKAKVPAKPPTPKFPW